MARDGAEGSLYWCDTRGFLHEIQGIDDHIQGGERTAPLLRLLGLV